MFCSVKRIFLCTLFFHFATGQLNIRTDGSTVTLSENVVLTCQDSSSTRRSIAFSFKSTTDTVFNIFGSCDLAAPICTLSDATKYGIHKDETNTAFNEFNATVKSFASSSFGCYRCQDLSNTLVYSELCIPYKANLTEKCGSIIECYDLNAECRDTKCQCKTNFQADKGICTPIPGPDYKYLAFLVLLLEVLTLILLLITAYCSCCFSMGRDAPLEKHFTAAPLGKPFTAIIGIFPTRDITTIFDKGKIGTTHQVPYFVEFETKEALTKALAKDGKVLLNYTIKVHQDTEFDYEGRGFHKPAKPEFTAVIEYLAPETTESDIRGFFDNSKMKVTTCQVSYMEFPTQRALKDALHKDGEISVDVGRKKTDFHLLVHQANPSRPDKQNEKEDSSCIQKPAEELPILIKCWLWFLLVLVLVLIPINLIVVLILLCCCKECEAAKVLEKLKCCCGTESMNEYLMRDVVFVLLVIHCIPLTLGLILLVPVCCKSKCCADGRFVTAVRWFKCSSCCSVCCGENVNTA